MTAEEFSLLTGNWQQTIHSKFQVAVQWLQHQAQFQFLIVKWSTPNFKSWTRTFKLNTTLQYSVWKLTENIFLRYFGDEGKPVFILTQIMPEPSSKILPNPTKFISPSCLGGNDNNCSHKAGYLQAIISIFFPVHILYQLIRYSETISSDPV